MLNMIETGVTGAISYNVEMLTSNRVPSPPLVGWYDSTSGIEVDPTFRYALS